MKRFLRTSLICLFVAGVLVLAGWMKGLRRDSTATWYDPSSWRLHFERSATTRFQIIQQRSGPTLCYFSGRAPTWQEHEMNSMIEEDRLRSVVKSLSLDARWGLSEPEAANKLRKMLEVKQEKGTDIVSLTARSSLEIEAVELADAVRDSYAAGRIRQEKELANRIIHSLDPRIASQLGVLEKTRQEMMDQSKDYRFRWVPGQEGPSDWRKKPAYLHARAEYESQLQLLNQMREMKIRLGADAITSPVVILEEAKPDSIL